MTLLGFTDTVCLEMLGITGPRSVNVGDDLTLTCRYDLGRDAIYRSVSKFQYICLLSACLLVPLHLFLVSFNYF